MTTHTLVKIEENAPAVGTAQKAPEALKVGHVNHGAELVDIYIGEQAMKQGETQVQRLQAMAGQMTYAEFKEAVSKAKELADTIDSANGFKKPEKGTVKGQANYGPKRQVLNARLGEAKRVFGVFKQSPTVLQGLGYWAAVNKARVWLDSEGRTWDCAPAKSAAEKRQERQEREAHAVKIAVYEANVQKAGESDADYMARVKPIIAAEVAKYQGNARTERIAKIAESILKQFKDDGDMLYEACEMVLAQMAEGNDTETTEQE